MSLYTAPILSLTPCMLSISYWYVRVSLLPHDFQICNGYLRSKPTPSTPVASLTKGAAMAKAAIPVVASITHVAG